MLLRLRLLLTGLQFLRKRRERLNAEAELARRERAAERAHQFQMLEVIFTKMVEMNASTMAGLTELARAQAAQADVMANWLKSFQVSDPTPTPAEIAEKEEWEPAIPGIELPPEFQLAFSLDRDRLASQTPEDFDREGSDFS